MELEMAKALRKSSILTQHSLHIVSSPSLPSLPLIRTQKQHNRSNSQQYSYLKASGRQQILEQTRKKDLLLLKNSLNLRHRQEISSQSKNIEEQDNSLDTSFSTKLEKRLNKFMSSAKKGEKTTYIEEVDPDKLDFINRCLKIAELHLIIIRENNMRFKNKIVQTLLRTSSKDEMMQLFDSLSNSVIDYNFLYSRYRKKYLSSKGSLRRDLKFISLTCQQLIQYYHNSRYKHLNDDILRMKCEMNKEGATIGRKLHGVDNTKLRNGIVRSLKNVDLACLAHRGLYDKVAEQLRQFQL